MSSSTEYIPPKVWKYDTKAGGKFATINRPTAGPTHEEKLPVGKHDLQLYSLGTPNGIKITILLEELLELGISKADYDAWHISIEKGQQFGSDFVDANPNSKIPVLVDHGVKNNGVPLRVFESGSILLYLAEKYGAFLPKDIGGKTEALNWLFWQVASAPFVGGGFGHFFSYAPVKLQYPIDRYALETKRQLDVLDRRLKEVPFIAGKEYSIADIAIYSWYGRLVQGHSYAGSAEFLSVDEYTHVKAWADKILARPAVKRGVVVNREDGLKERHSAADFDKVNL